MRKHLFVQEGLCALEHQHPPQLGGGDLRHRVFYKIYPVSGIFILPLFFCNGCLFSLIATVEYRKGDAAQDPLRFLPGMEGQEHVRSHKQHQFILGITLL